MPFECPKCKEPIIFHTHLGWKNHGLYDLHDKITKGVIGKTK